MLQFVCYEFRKPAFLDKVHRRRFLEIKMKQNVVYFKTTFS